MSDERRSTASMLRAATSGDVAAIGALTPLIYEELRRQARYLMQSERKGHTLQPTALVHEAFLRLIGPGSAKWNDEAHFLALACRSMRRVLVDHARARGTQKRGGGRVRVSFQDPTNPGSEHFLDLLSLDEALVALAKVAERRATVAEIRIFSGGSFEQIGAVLGISEKTAEADWYLARAWLRRQLAREE